MKLFFRSAALAGIGNVALHTGHRRGLLVSSISLPIQAAQKVCPHGSSFGKLSVMFESYLSQHISQSIIDDDLMNSNIIKVYLRRNNYVFLFTFSFGKNINVDCKLLNTNTLSLERERERGRLTTYLDYENIKKRILFLQFLDFSSRVSSYESCDT